MAKIYNSKILDFSSEPFKKPEGQFWYDATNKVLKRSDGTAFSPIRIDKNIVDDANNTLASKLSLLDGIEKDNVKNTIQYSGGVTTILGGTSVNEGTTIVQACDTISLKNSWGVSFGIGDDDYRKISASGRSFTFNGNEIATSVDLANKQNTLSQYSEVKGTAENNYASSVRLQGFAISLTAEDPSGSVITIGNASYSQANQINLNADYISGTGVVNNLHDTDSDQKLPSVLAVVNALSEKQNTLDYYNEESNSTATIDPNTLYINNTNSLNIITGVNGDVTYNSITSDNTKFELYNYYNNEYDSATLSLEEGQITLDSREDILFNLSQFGTTVPVELSMHLEGDLLDIPKVELKGIDRLNVAETLKVNNKPVALAEDLNNKQDKLSYYTEDDAGSVSINAGHILSLNSIEGFSLSDTYNNRISASGPSGMIFSTGINNTDKYFKLSYDGENDFINAEGIDNLSINNSIKINNEDVLTASSLNSINSDLTSLKTLTNGITATDGTIIYAGPHATQIGSTSTDHYQTIITSTDVISISTSWDAGINFGLSSSSYADIRIYGDTLTFDCDALKFKNEDVLTTSALNGYIKENTKAALTGIQNVSSSALEISSYDPNVSGPGNDINISGGYYGITTIAGDGDFENDHPRLIVDPSNGISLLHKDVIINTTETITGNANTVADVRITTNNLELNATSISGSVISTEIDAASTNNQIVTAKAVYDIVQENKLQAGPNVSISDDNIISVKYPGYEKVITSEQTIANLSLNSIIADSDEYVLKCGKIIITPDINNVGPIYFGENLSSTTNGFPVYPDQIVTLEFSNLNDFKVYSSAAGNKFNYIAYIGNNNIIVQNGEGGSSGNVTASSIKLRSPNGTQYSISITNDGIIEVA